MDKKIIITISREFGSGGRYIGETVANKLNIPFYDKAIIEMASEKTGFSPDYIKENEQKIFEIANKYLANWNIDRLSKVDKAILSIGIYELLYTETPSVVAINEAIELSKKYSDEKVTKMLNATLDKIYHNEV